VTGGGRFKLSGGRPPPAIEEVGGGGQCGQVVGAVWPGGPPQLSVAGGLWAGPEGGLLGGGGRGVTWRRPEMGGTEEAGDGRRGEG
jgi:hypothetical protein